MKSQVLAQLITMGRYDITLNGKSISYTLKRSTKAKLIWLDIKRQTGLTVTVPQDYNISNLKDYLKNNSNWILNNFSKYCENTPCAPPSTVPPEYTVSYLGKSLKVMQNRSACGLNAVTLENNNLIVSLHSSGVGLSSLELEHWLKSQAVKIINDKGKQFSTIMGLQYNRVVIRNQKTRWGSCSCLKNLNFNWRLIMAPEAVLDYVIIHELCHLREMSHSKAFWALVARFCPRWHEYRDWLDNHSLEMNGKLKF
jgi:predicted metal-dependent hydrolase